MIPAIYIILLATISLLFLAFKQKDYWLIIICSFSMIFIGLYSLNVSFGDLENTFRVPFGIIIIFIGVYLVFRSGIESIKSIDKEDK
jgi:uncharacterized membrane protein YfcA